jgi:molybdenum cofactor cytidylyltransferase
VAAGIRGLLLCGGRATRFGRDKLVHAIAVAGTAERVPMAALAARHLREGAGHVLAVIPAGAARLRAALDAERCEILESERTVRGLGASLAAGVSHSAGAAGWIVALGDMPDIRPATIAEVRSRLEAGAIVAAPVSPDGRRGHPVGFSRAILDELRALDGDEGARSVVARHLASFTAIVSDDPGIFIDIDSVADLAARDSTLER